MQELPDGGGAEALQALEVEDNCTLGAPEGFRQPGGKLIHVFPGKVARCQHFNLS